MSEAELVIEKKIAHEKSIVEVSKSVIAQASGLQPLTVAAWLLVLIPISFGILSTVQKAAVLFG